MLFLLLVWKEWFMLQRGFEDAVVLSLARRTCNRSWFRRICLDKMAFFLFSLIYTTCVLSFVPPRSSTSAHLPSFHILSGLKNILFTDYGPNFVQMKLTSLFRYNVPKLQRQCLLYIVFFVKDTRDLLERFSIAYT